MKIKKNVFVVKNQTFAVLKFSRGNGSNIITSKFESQNNILPGPKMVLLDQNRASERKKKNLDTKTHHL